MTFEHRKAQTSTVPILDSAGSQTGAFPFGGSRGGKDNHGFSADGLTVHGKDCGDDGAEEICLKILSPE